MAVVQSCAHSVALPKARCAAALLAQSAACLGSDSSALLYALMAPLLQQQRQSTRQAGFQSYSLYACAHLC
jgi:hypothetical protein